MVYSNNFVATVKAGGKILRETDNSVTLPFGVEYSIFLKNLNSVRAVVRVTIDGQPLSDVADGWFIINANDTLELERFLRNGNFKKGNRLKFIERTAEIENYKGGIGAEDGLVRVEYKFEKVYNPLQVQHHYYWNSYPYNYPNYTITTTGINTGGGVTYTCGTIGEVSTDSTSSASSVFTVGEAQTGYNTGNSNIQSSTNEIKAANFLRTATTPTRGMPRQDCASGQESRRVQAASFNQAQNNAQNNSNMFMEASLNDAGITVAGSESNQKFGWGSYFPTEDASHVIVLKLIGRVGNTPVARPVTVQAKPTCTTCGKVNKATSKFCGRCGTALHLI